MASKSNIRIVTRPFWAPTTRVLPLVHTPAKLETGLKSKGRDRNVDSFQITQRLDSSNWNEWDSLPSSESAILIDGSPTVAFVRHDSRICGSWSVHACGMYAACLHELNKRAGLNTNDRTACQINDYKFSAWWGIHWKWRRHTMSGEPRVGNTSVQPVLQRQPQ